MTTLRHLFRFGLLAAGAASSYATHAQTEALSWQSCQTINDADARLACFDQWANAQQQPAEAAFPPPRSAASALNHTEGKPIASPDQPTPGSIQRIASEDNCRNTAYSTLSRFYELERGTDCGTLRLRGYHPQSVSLTFADNINQQPSSPSQGAAPREDRQSKELRLQLSIRSKLASGLFTPADSERLDSLWVGYTQLSYWQVFNADDSRPFRTTDHKPEIFYVYPSSLQLPFNWRLRYSGIGVQHHSNGQSDPLSRSWNQIYLMAGAELNDRWQLQLKTWRRIPERASDDDNPDIQKYWGRAEAKLFWHVNDKNTLGLSARGSLGRNYGSGSLEWMRTIGQSWSGNKSNLRLHVQLFSGYGESLIDYNYKRTSLSIGLSLLDF